MGYFIKDSSDNDFISGFLIKHSLHVFRHPRWHSFPWGSLVLPWSHESFQHPQCPSERLFYFELGFHRFNWIAFALTGWDINNQSSPTLSEPLNLANLFHILCQFHANLKQRNSNNSFCLRFCLSLVIIWSYFSTLWTSGAFPGLTVTFCNGGVRTLFRVQNVRTCFSNLYSASFVFVHQRRMMLVTPEPSV